MEQKKPGTWRRGEDYSEVGKGTPSDFSTLKQEIEMRKSNKYSTLTKMNLIRANVRGMPFSTYYDRTFDCFGGSSTLNGVSLRISALVLSPSFFFSLPTKV